MCCRCWLLLSSHLLPPTPRTNRTPRYTLSLVQSFFLYLSLSLSLFLPLSQSVCISSFRMNTLQTADDRLPLVTNVNLYSLPDRLISSLTFLRNLRKRADSFIRELDGCVFFSVWNRRKGIIGRSNELRSRTLLRMCMRGCGRRSDTGRTTVRELQCLNRV